MDAVAEPKAPIPTIENIIMFPIIAVKIWLYSLVCYMYETQKFIREERERLKKELDEYEHTDSKH